MNDSGKVKMLIVTHIRYLNDCTMLTLSVTLSQNNYRNTFLEFLKFKLKKVMLEVTLSDKLSPPVKCLHRKNE